MANNVFANGREISCKAADGKSICSFPDVCFTPPQTPATPPGVPIPYPNTGFAKDMTKGSKNVKISNKEVMLKNKSYFKKSTGDEAGRAPKKGVITSKITGKVFFNSWSMNVKIEKSNVVRHLDLTTHNHGSTPGNTPPWPYLDSMAFDMSSNHPCKNMAKEVDEKCSKHISTTGKGDIKRKQSIEAMCNDSECKEARKCVLSPENPNNCCDNKTPHHVIPAHCFMGPGERGKTNEQVYEGCDGYQSKKAPCICVSGRDKSTGDHKRIHKIFDPIEDSNMIEGKAGTWKYENAANAGAASVAKATGCDENCTRAQIDSYHQKKAPGKPSIGNDSNLRADSTGKRTPEDFSTTAEGSDL